MLCDAVALERSEKEICLTRMSDAIGSFVTSYRKVLDNLVGWYLRKALKVVTRISLANYTGIYFETEDLNPNSIQRFVEENLALVEESWQVFR